MDKKWQFWNWERTKKIRAMWAAAVLFAVAVLIFGINGSKNGPEQSEAVAETSEPVIQEELPVSEMEEVLLSTLYETMENSMYADAARILNENEESFTGLAADTFGGERFCYWETEYEDGTVIRNLAPLDEAEVMRGMVLTRYNTVFFGTFKNGKPEGECHAIQAMILDEPRYTFAEGLWKDGKMNGDGRTGYHYYRNTPTSGFVMTDKVGTYKDNVLDGTFVYQTESVLGEKLSWEMKAEMGVTVIDDAWTHFPLRKEYALGSKEDSARAYMISEEKMNALMWNNLITWDE